MPNKRKIINDPVFGFLSIPNELIYDVLQHPYVQRLNRIRQLGLSYLVYPGAMHSRFGHSLGAMHLMHEAISSLRLKGVAISEEEETSAMIAILLLACVGTHNSRWRDARGYIAPDDGAD